jgi:serine/threonine protein kinase
LCCQPLATRPVWKKVSKEAKELVQLMLVVDPTQRLSASECLMHPWITGSAHSDQHLQHLEDAQLNMKSRMERKKAAAK